MIKELTILLALLHATVKSTLTLRGSFIARLALMALNNLIFFSTWVILFSHVGTIGDWGLNEMCLLWGISACSFGIANGVLGGYTKIPELVRSGGLDSYLLKPSNVLLQIWTARSEPSAWGDLLSGAFLFWMSGYVSLASLPMLALVLLCAASVFISLGTVFYSIAFWQPDCDDISVRFTELIIAFGSYPETIFSSAVKIFLYTLLPAAFVSFLPVAVMRNLNGSDILLMIAGSTVLMLLAVIIFFQGLRRYESGNRWSVHGA